MLLLMPLPPPLLLLVLVVLLMMMQKRPFSFIDVKVVDRVTDGRTKRTETALALQPRVEFGLAIEKKYELWPDVLVNLENSFVSAVKQSHS